VIILKILLYLSQENAVGIPGVLIVSAATGTGHRRAAEAVQDAFAETAPGLSVKHVDLLSLASRWVRTAYGDGFELLATRAPRIWGQVYRRTDAASPELARWGPLAHRILFREFRKLLLSRDWGACVCTHFLPGQLAAGGAGIPPFSMVITDLTLHHYWAQPRVGRYFVASERLAGELRARVPRVAVEATGIPVAPAFARAPGRAAARSELGIEADRVVALVMGGGLGIGVEETAQAAAAALVPGLQTIVICGRNAEAAARLSRRWAGDDRVRVLGYVDTVERYIAAADIVVTKPGGLTTSEVLAIGRPLLLTNAIPGQEEGNARVLTTSGAAVFAQSPAAVTGALRQILQDSGALERMAAAAREIARPMAAHRIAEVIASDLDLTRAA
jgi:processive 1,2-diacylglycerol beta-glucosyltransferase